MVSECNILCEKSVCLWMKMRNASFVNNCKILFANPNEPVELVAIIVYVWKSNKLFRMKISVGITAYHDMKLLFCSVAGGGRSPISGLESKCMTLLLAENSSSLVIYLARAKHWSSFQCWRKTGWRQLLFIMMVSLNVQLLMAICY